MPGMKNDTCARAIFYINMKINYILNLIMRYLLLPEHANCLQFDAILISYFFQQHHRWVYINYLKQLVSPFI